MSDGWKNTIDIGSLGVFLGYILSALPVIALIFTVLWAFFRLMEMRTTHVILYKLFGWRLDNWLSLPGNRHQYKDTDDDQ